MRAVVFIKKFVLPAVTGFAAGILNGLFGSGGGIVAALFLPKSGLSVNESQATALFMMFCLSVLSVFLYYSEGAVSFEKAAVFLPGGIIGALLSSAILKKIDPFVLRKIFGGFITFSAARMIWGLVSEWL